MIAKQQDETEYLLSNEINRLKIEKSLSEIENGNVISFDFENFVSEYDQKIQAAL